MNRCVLVIDDNTDVLPRTHNAWAKRGYAQHCVKSGEEAAVRLIHGCESHKDVCLIALVADYLNGRLLPMVELIRHITSLPLLILSTEYNANIKIQALEAGADTYLPVPETIEEGIITGLAMIRRPYMSGGQSRNEDMIFLTDDFYISREERRAFLNSHELKLTRSEFDLLWFLAVNKNQTLSCERIYENVWGDEYNNGSERSVWSMVGRLRKKLNSGHGVPDYIHSERHLGYRLTV